MKTTATLLPGTKVETGDSGTPSYRVGLVVGTSDPETLGRGEGESSVLVAWESGEEYWAEFSTLRVAP